jgi:hypothetical protein
MSSGKLTALITTKTVSPVKSHVFQRTTLGSLLLPQWIVRLTLRTFPCHTGHHRVLRASDMSTAVRIRTRDPRCKAFVVMSTIRLPLDMSRNTSRGMSYHNSKASSPGCPDPTNLWLDLLDLWACDNVPTLRVRHALHVDSLDRAEVRHFCMLCLLDHFYFLTAWPRYACAACDRFLLTVSIWFGLLLLMRPCLLVGACLLLAWCAVASAFSRCRPRAVLLGGPPLLPSVWEC